MNFILKILCVTLIAVIFGIVGIIFPDYEWWIGYLNGSLITALIMKEVL